ncbi:MAG: phosphatidate cytidylyltransferase [Magnetospirillum sp.]
MLLPRILSALVMIPVALAAIWWGGYAFAVLVAVAGAVMVWEWDRMTGGGFTTGGRIAAGLVAVASLMAFVWPVASLALVLLAAAIAGRRAEMEGQGRRFWALSGAFYCGLPAIALVWLRGNEDSGLYLMLWLMMAVWATDIGAYAAGRTIGGPLLMPVVSPKKTWAGLIGGMVSAALVGGASAWAFPLGVEWGMLAVVSAVLAIVAQAGDLLESWVKRRFGVKDSSNIIPGHGGVLDRVDGLLSAGLAVALFRLMVAL